MSMQKQSLTGSIVILTIVIAALISSCQVNFGDLMNPSPDFSDPLLSGTSVVYVADLDAENIWLIDGETGKKIKTIDFPGGTKLNVLNSFAFVPDYSAFYVTDGVNKKIFYVKADVISRTIQRTESWLGGIAIHPSGAFGYIGASDGDLVILANNEIIKTSYSNLGTYFTQDGTRAYSALDGSYGSISQVWVTDTATSENMAKYFYTDTG